MFDNKGLVPFEKHVHLAIATPHEEMMTYIREAFDSNWITTEGENVREVNLDLLVFGRTIYRAIW